MTSSAEQKIEDDKRTTKHIGLIVLALIGITLALVIAVMIIV